MNLAQGKINYRYEVESFVLEDEVLRRLQSLGITEGTELFVLNRKSNGSYIIKVRGTRWAIGKQIASGVIVKEID